MRFSKLGLIAILCLIIFVLTVSAEEKKAGGKYADTLPEFSLKDAAGKEHSSKALAQNGLVLVVTAPIKSNKNVQRGWSQQLREAKGSKEAKWAFLEDMTPSNFKKIALRRMKKAYKPGHEPILLIDSNGDIRQKLGVKPKETVVLVYDQNQKLIASETGAPTAAAAQKIWGALK